MNYDDDFKLLDDEEEVEGLPEGDEFNPGEEAFEEDDPDSRFT